MAATGANETMTEQECWSMLETVSVGRVAFVDDSELVLLPVNYRVSQGGIVFRTSPNGRLAVLPDYEGDVVFEVDHHDDLYQSGWSVVVLGASRAADAEDDLTAEDAERLRPWAAGDRPLLVRIDPRSLTGRRVTLE